MDDDLLKEFVNESRDHLTDIEADLLRIEEGGANIDEALVNKVFRAAHSIKGGSGFFGLNRVKELSHKAETILDMLRSRKMAPNAEVTNLLLSAFDKLRDMMNHIAESEQADISDLVVSLTGLASSYLPAQQKATLYMDVKLPPPQGGVPISLPQTDFDRAKRTGKCIYLANCDLIHDIERKGQNILELFRKLTTAGEILDCAVDFSSVGTLDEPVGNRLPLRFVVATVLEPGLVSGLFGTLEEHQIQLLFDPHASQPLEPALAPTPQEVPAPPPLPVTTEVVMPQMVASTVPVESAAVAVVEPAAAPRAASTTSQATPAEDTLRVNVELLERLMNLAGELVLSRNQLRAAVAQDNRQSLLTVNQRVNQVTSEIQDVIMQTRLQPIGNVLSKFPRVVRDLSRSLSKEIDLDIQGKDVALDKTMIEGLSDPLSHMVRNAVDHGVETTEERKKAGKKPAGKIRIEARHEAGQVVVEIADDGKGIDPARVADAAVRKGLITAEKVRGMSDRDKQALIFLPGLSTAQKVTDVSGRGVGMDVVKTNLDRLGGLVEIDSVLGKGSTFRIKLPLTLAIIPSLIVSVGNERFAIPQTNIEELLRLRPEEIKNRIENVGDSKVLLLRDRVLPLADFAELIADAEAAARGDARPPDAANAALEIAVVTTGVLSFGLVVGCFHDTEEVVVKPLGRRLKHLREYSGATILGDGAVALILDMAGVAAKANLASVSESERAEDLAAQAEARMRDTQSLLLFQNAPGESFAIPLDLVQRIERIKPTQVERFGQHRTMQYHGGSLPLVALSDAATVGSLDGVENLVVLVSNVCGREVGLLGAMPVDVVETQTVIDQTTHRQRGIIGSAIIREQTTLIADLYEIVDTVHPEWRAHAPVPVAVNNDTAPTPHLEASGFSGEPAAPANATTILLAEDSDFFRAQVKKYMEEDGYRVLAAPDGEAAWELLQQNLETVRLVVTDIEMPRLTGLGLAARIRADEHTAKLPVIAVSSLAGDEDIARGKKAGVSEYLVKLDRDKLLGCLHEMLPGGASARIGSGL